VEGPFSSFIYEKICMGKKELPGVSGPFLGLGFRV